jgi:maltose alpha-D-glucosyltransferase/alpha-amylase
MQWTAGENAGFSNGKPSNLFQPLIKEGNFSYKKINVASQIENEESFLSRMRKLVKVRKKHKAFSKPHYSIIHEDQRESFSIMRCDENEAIYCFHNLTNKKQEIPLDKGNFKLLHASSDFYDSREKISKMVIVNPYSYVWLTKV